MSSSKLNTLLGSCRKYWYIKSRDSTVSIVTGYGRDSWVSIPSGSKKFFSTPERVDSRASRSVLGPTEPPIQLVMGNISLGVKRPGHEARHSPPSSAKLKND
jgi:hypothetical protein